MKDKSFLYHRKNLKVPISFFTSYPQHKAAQTSPSAKAVRPEAATIADSDGESASASRVAATAVGSIKPTAAGLIGDPTESPPLLRHKRGREEDPKAKSEGGNASKRRRVLESPR